MEKKTGIELIAEERERQIKQVGWTKEHDAEHTSGELAYAAAAYALPNEIVEFGEDESYVETFQVKFKRIKLWPFERRWWKPKPDNRIRELAKAGALIAAEIDRLNEVNSTQQPITRVNE